MMLNSKIITFDCMIMCLLSSESVSAFAVPSSSSPSLSSFITTTTPRISDGVQTHRFTSTSTKLQMSLEPLAKEGSWTAYLDEENTGLIYYFNTVTGESSWDPPTSTFPPVKVSRRKEARMAAIQREYNEKNTGVATFDTNDGASSTATADEDGGFGGGIFASLFAPKEDEQTTRSSEAANQVVDEEKEIEKISQSAKENTPLFKMFGGNSEKTKNASQSAAETVDIQNEAEDTNGVNGNANGGGLVPPPFLNNFFGQQTSEPAEEKLEETPVEDNLNGVENSSTDAPAAVGASSFLNNFFGQGNAATNAQVEQETEEEFYDQALYEDAVIADEPEVVQPIKLEIASKIMPHPEKVSWGGEDALFVSGKSFGVFDGVSGAEKLDGVPLYSNTLAQQLKSTVGKKGLTVDEIKEKMLKAAEYADMAATGASTAVVASVGDDDILRAVNLGDSVLMIVRDGSIKARVKETVHYFDCPYQLSDDSPDRPRNGSVLQTPLQKGDLIIAGSDGVFDNISDPFLLEIVEKNSKGSISKLAQQIVSESRKVSKDPDAMTPYARMAKRNNYAAYSRGVGGKIDDISCIVVRCK